MWKNFLNKPKQNKNNQQLILGQPAPSPQVRPQSIRSRRVAVHPAAFRGPARCFSRRDASGVGPSSGESARNQRAMMVLQASFTKQEIRRNEMKWFLYS